MSGAIADIVKIGTLGLVDLEPDKPKEVEDTSLTQGELAALAEEESQRKAKTKAATTSTVLTSPLGATGAQTANKKLGG